MTGNPDSGGCGQASSGKSGLKQAPLDSRLRGNDEGKVMQFSFNPSITPPACCQSGDFA
jgi:hypothetical protein